MHIFSYIEKFYVIKYVNDSGMYIRKFLITIQSFGLPLKTRKFSISYNKQKGRIYTILLSIN